MTLVLTQTQPTGAGLATAALAAGNPAALVGCSRRGRRWDSRDSTTGAVSEEFPGGAGATSSCRDNQEKKQTDFTLKQRRDVLEKTSD